ncbi:autorepressor SdpR family transcription factor [Mollicutes bacterium LVI A0078]|nr:autorepressor SdpR family transcription factor [Mollicutes bacterium LVI A0075]WOO91612.1 autorepressor SdpR family transcription factor [Mollicutes bacterium LVI A0078]
MDLVFKCLSSKIRRDILNLLRSGEMTASDIASNFDVSKPTISHHLSLLKDADLIDVRRDGNSLYYSIKTSVVEDLYSYFLDLKEK